MRRLDTPFVRFLLTGGFAAGVNILARLALSPFVAFEAAVAVAYLVGMVTAYALARLFVFTPSGQSVGTEFVRFALVNAVSFTQVWIVSVALARWLFPALGFSWHADLVAHVTGVLSPVVTSYYGHKLFTFRSADATDR